MKGRSEQPWVKDSIERDLTEKGLSDEVAQGRATWR